MNGNYPISDLDVILTPPSGPVVNSCNTARTPELCVVSQSGRRDMDGDGRRLQHPRLRGARAAASTTRCGSRQTTSVLTVKKNN